MLRKKNFNEQKAKTKIFQEAWKVNKIIVTDKVHSLIFSNLIRVSFALRSRPVEAYRAGKTPARVPVIWF
jgi:hypothetical protein